ncbi:hypothetical protein [Caldimonas brevitalea]|uniref:Uncharacterized protein n=1 Tax=Caldimonas brevitalea TaxID=413882 RepID=A0A0G3BG28_9BURK|nr:hypothetical protein [Caldimonas brevitalea]AKJ28374.1 hypothetical protein AAW51_1683 [Caldimonas brevitalea]
MVNKALPLLLAAMTLSMGVGAGQEKRVENDPNPPVYPMTTVTAVDIKRNGAWTDDVSSHETPETCSRFTLTWVDVRTYFEKAKQINLRRYSHDLTQSRCYAEGTLKFANGDRARWHIDSVQRGSLVLSDGRTFYFYCAACTDDPEDEDLL